MKRKTDELSVMRRVWAELDRLPDAMAIRIAEHTVQHYREKRFSTEATAEEIAPEPNDSLPFV